jgi:hypothetical protein
VINVSQIDVVIGTTAVRRSSFALDHFMQNLHEIQRNYDRSEVVIATDETDFAEDLDQLLNKYKIFGRVIVYETENPDQRKNQRLCSITSGRNAIVDYLLNSDSPYLLFLDSDMTYDPRIIDIMKREINGHDVLQSGYMVRSKTIEAVGFGGCSLIKREILSKIRFRFYEFENGRVIDEFNIFEYDLVRKGARIRKGVFLSVDHYISHDEAVSINPRNLSAFQKITTFPILRYILLHLSIISRYDITRYLQHLVYGRS